MDEGLGVALVGNRREWDITQPPRRFGRGMQNQSNSPRRSINLAVGLEHVAAHDDGIVQSPQVNRWRAGCGRTARRPTRRGDGPTGCHSGRGRSSGPGRSGPPARGRCRSGFIDHATQGPGAHGPPPGRNVPPGANFCGRRAAGGNQKSLCRHRALARDLQAAPATSLPLRPYAAKVCSPKSLETLGVLGLAKVGVEGSNPFARSRKPEGFPLSRHCRLASVLRTCAESDIQFASRAATPATSTTSPTAAITAWSGLLSSSRPSSASWAASAPTPRMSST